MKKFIDYYEYIKSKEWKVKSDEFKAKAGNKCRVCYSSNQLNSHHRTYDNLGNETDDDVTVLCRNCHELFSLKDKFSEPPVKEEAPEETERKIQEKIKHRSKVLKQYLYDLEKTNKYDAPVFIGFIDREKEIKQVKEHLRMLHVRSRLKEVAQRLRAGDTFELNEEFLDIFTQ